MRPFFQKYLDFLNKNSIDLQSSPWGSTWIYGYSSSIPSEGFKIHISLEKEKIESDDVFSIMTFLLKRSVNFKLIRLDCFELLTGSQQGKNLVLYPSLEEVNELIEDLLIQFPLLKETPLLSVPFDALIAGRIFTRYAGYSRDQIWNPEQKTYVYWGRTEPQYKPDWIPEPNFMKRLI